jgi:MFS family permease
MAVGPPIGLALLQQQPNMLFVAAAAMAALAGLLTGRAPSVHTARRPFGLAFHSAWIGPLLVGILSVIQWGAIAAFLPINAVDAGSNPALLFTADAIAVLAARIPAGWMADRYGPMRLGLVGVIGMTLSVLSLLLPLNDGVLIVAGILNGGGAGLVLPPMLAQLSQRSNEATRGTALAYFSVAFAVGMILGSSAGGLLYPSIGFHGLLSIGAVLCAGGIVVLLTDDGFRFSLSRPVPGVGER